MLDSTNDSSVDDAQTIVLNVSDVVFREDLYVRIKPDPQKIQQYSEVIEKLPPIEINQHNELIDGTHRWLAHRKASVTQINIVVTRTRSDQHLRELSIERNAKHGLQMSPEDKRREAIRSYLETSQADRKEKKKSLVDLLSVTLQTLNRWLTDIDKQYRAERDAKIQALYLACYTQDEIAHQVDLAQSVLVKKIKEISLLNNCSKVIKLAQNYEFEDDSLPKFTVWSFGSKTNKVGHFGNSEQTIVDWLVYLYTDPLDIVIDPFAGGGATIDVCQKRRRRYWASDRKPVIERGDDIRQHDLIGDDGSVALPELAGRWADVKLIYLDPPYWKQAEGKYSDDPTDLANMDEDTFHASLANIINSFAKKAPNAHIALLMQPTQWNAPEKRFVDHAFIVASKIKRPIDTRIQAPYQKANCQPPMYAWAEKNKKLLVLSREIIVWGVSK